MKGKWDNLLRPLMGLIWVIVFILFYYLIFFNRDIKTVSSWLLCVFIVIGISLGYVVHSVLHEIGHIIPLKKGQTKILEFSVLFLLFKRDGKSLKCRICKNEYSGYVTFVCNNPNQCKKYLKSSLVWSFVFSLLSLAIFAVLLIVLRNNILLFTLFCFAFMQCLMQIMLNFLCAMPTSDGYLLFGGKAKLYPAVIKMETQSRLYIGESLKEMPDNLFSIEDNYQNGYYSYLRLMEKGELEMAEKLLEGTYAENAKSFDNQLIALDLEKFYIALIKKDETTINELKDDILNFCDDNVNVTTLRVVIKYRKYTGEDDWVNALSSSFERQQERALIGAYRTEKTIIDNFS